MSRYDFAPLVPLIERQWRQKRFTSHIAITGKTADVLGVNRREVLRWRHTGLDAYAADRAAIALDRHPAEIWPEWLDWSLEAVS